MSVRDRYDLIAIGSGPAGHGAALQAAKLGKRAAVAERSALGGASVNSGTVPAQTLRAAIVEFASAARIVPHELVIGDLLWRSAQAIEHEREAIQDELRRKRVDVLSGSASFLDPHTLLIESSEGSLQASAERFVIAVGTRPARPLNVAFDDRTVLDSDGILQLSTVPRTLVVVGATVYGLEVASMAAALGTHVTVVDRRSRMLDFVDDELVEALRFHLAGVGVMFRLGVDVQAVERTNAGVVSALRNGERITSELVFYAAGRQAATSDLNLAAAGLEPANGGRIRVDPGFRTAQRHIFAAGEVVNFPSSDATSTEQGRLAALAAFDEPIEISPSPHGIYTIPELSFVGSSERELAAGEVRFVRGRARYRELTRGAIAGDRSGLLKLLVHAETRRLLGVHAFGTGATELIHLGQTVMAAGLTVEYLAEAVFNVPTFAGAYKVAALDAACRIADMGDRRARALAERIA